MKIKISIIGCGAITRTSHIPSILKNPRFQLIALIDKNIEAAERLMTIYGIKAYISDSLEAIPDTDAAVVAVPPHLHAEITISLLKKGIHVLCEKPIATRVSDAHEMVKVAERQKRVLLVGIHKYQSPNTKLTLDILRDGFIGDLRKVRLVSAIKSQWATGNLKRFDPSYVPGGALFEHGIHWIYRILYWFGYPQLIKYTDDRIDGVEANAFVDCVFKEFGQDVPGSMFFSWDYGSQNKLSILGSDGVAEIYHHDDSCVYVIKSINGFKKMLQVKNINTSDEFDAFYAQLDYFAHVIERKDILPVATKLAYKTSEFVDECYRNRSQIDQPWVFHCVRRR